MMEHRLPLVTRWTVYALGAVEGQRVRRPRDPVAAWLLRRHPELLPAFAAPSILAMIRARASIVDRMIGDEANRMNRAGQRLDYWGFGGGLDARWHRMRPLLEPITQIHCEVEEPEVIEFKHEALSASNFSNSWQRIQRVPVREDRWTVQDAAGDATLVVLEGVASRLGLESVKRMLGRIRRDAPNARVVLDLPGVLQGAHGAGPLQAGGSSSTTWTNPESSSAAALRCEEIGRLGWRIEEDIWLAGRPELRAPSGMPLCAGMESLRVLKLVAT